MRPLAYSNVFLIYILDDPDINISMSKYKYRSFLNNHVSFLKIAKIKEQRILDKIHMNFRIIFLKDTASARWIEESTYELLMHVNLHKIIDDEYKL